MAGHAAETPGSLQGLSNVPPLTCAAYGLRDVMLKGADLGWPAIHLDRAVVLAFGVVLVVAATLRRRMA